MPAPRPAHARRQPRRLHAACAALALLLTACGSSDTSRFGVVVIGDAQDPFRTGPELPYAAQLTYAATAEGLVSFDEQGRVGPALADRWIVTDDGQSYIFRLREGNWRDGEPLTAKSAKVALDAAIRTMRRTPMALDLAGIDEVRVMAGRVIEIRLFRPMPFLLQILAQPELGLRHDKRGDGPMILTREGEVARFTPIEPSRLGLPEVPDWTRRTRELDVTALPAAAAVQRFNDGDVDLVLGGQIQDFPLTSTVGILRGTIQLDPVLGLFGLHVAKADGFLADPQNREALAMAIDRTALIAPFGVSGWTPSTRLVSPGVDGDLATNGERWQDLAPDQRRATAAARVRAWGTTIPQEKNAPPAALELAIWLPNGPGSDILFNRLSEDWRAIGIGLRRVNDREHADLRLIDEVARYPRVAWFLNRLSCAALRGSCDPDADEIVKDAVKVTDSAQRASMLAEAEANLARTNVFIPFGSPIRWSLVRGGVDGFATNAWNWHPLMPLARVHK